MPKFLFFSDLHCHNYEQFSHKLASGRNSRFQDCLNIVHQASEIASTKDLDTVFFLGDVFHSRVKIDVDVLSSTYEAFKELSSRAKLVMLVGNHDQHTKVGDVHSPTIFKDFATVIDVPTIQNISGVSVAMYPHTSDVEGMRGWLRQMPQVDLLLFHQGIKEAEVGPYDMHVKTELSLSDLPLEKVRYAIAGDFHKRQEIGKFHYVGSPLQLSFSERTERKYFSFIGDDWKIVPLPTSAPCFFKYEDSEQFRKDVEDKACDPFRDFIRISGKDITSLESLKALYPRVQVVFEEESKETTARIDKATALSDRSLLEAWIQTNPSGVSAEDLLTDGISLLENIHE